MTIGSGAPFGGTPADETAKGTAYGLVAYAVWGAFPLYFHALAPAGPIEILAHRIVWTLALCVVVLLLLRDVRWVPALVRQPRLLGGLTLAAVAIAVNWGFYVAAVAAHDVADASLGYFLNPLVTVALGVVVLGEHLRRLQWAAVAVGVVAGVYLTVAAGHVPWISFVLAVSFAAYGLLKKRLGVGLPALHGLTVETVVLAPFALVVLVVLGRTGAQTFTADGGLHPTLLVLGGVVTAIPLLLFAAAARRIPLVTIGLLQFITPVLQLLCGVLLLGERLSTARWAGFGIVWVALLLLTVDSLLAARRSPRGRRSVVAAQLPGERLVPEPAVVVEPDDGRGLALGGVAGLDGVERGDRRGVPDV